MRPKKATYKKKRNKELFFPFWRFFDARRESLLFTIAPSSLSSLFLPNTLYRRHLHEERRQSLFTPQATSTNSKSEYQGVYNIILFRFFLSCYPTTPLLVTIRVVYYVKNFYNLPSHPFLFFAFAFAFPQISSPYLFTSQSKILQRPNTSE